MAGRKLKHFDKYLGKLNNYASALGITIRYTDIDDEGAYSPHTKRINIHPDLPNSMELGVLLHELGHAGDATIVGPNHDETLDYAYQEMHHYKHSKKQLKIVIQAEERAWTYGRTIAKMLKIPLGKWYDEVEKECLNTYKKES